MAPSRRCQTLQTPVTPLATHDVEVESAHARAAHTRARDHESTEPQDRCTRTEQVSGEWRGRTKRSGARGSLYRAAAEPSSWCSNYQPR